MAPPELEAASQDGVLATHQSNGLVPVLFNAKSWAAMSNGPPATPLATKPANGEMTRASGGPARALIRFVPAGVPQPVHRSYPGTAGYLPALPLQILSPLVMS